VRRRGSPEVAASRETPPRILGVDPGSLRTGWGLVVGSGSRPRLLDCGVIRLRGGEDLARRLARLQEALADLVGRLQPTSAAVESPFHGKNVRSVLHLAHARGAILATLAAAGVDVVEYAPATVKKAVTGNGAAPKEQVRGMVHRLLGVEADPGPCDLTDALALALCHAAARGPLAALARAGLTRPGPGSWR